MASLPLQAAAGLNQDGNIGYSQNAKLRGRAMVKPILKKLNSHSNSDRGSFDIDRTWDDQPSPLGFPTTTLEYNSAFGENAPALSPLSSSFAHTGSDGYKSARDVSFSSSVEYPTWRGARSKYSHGRSTSGTSHTSSIATTVSARNGSFVHPFQQTPRTATPPLSYANSMTSLDTAVPVTRDYSPAIDEYDGSVSPLSYNKPYHTSSLTRSVNKPSPPPPYSTSLFQRPSLTSSQRSSSLSDGKQTPRPMQAGRADSGSVVHLAHSSTNTSRPELAASSLSSAFDTPLSSTAPLSSTPLTALSSSSPYTSVLSASVDMGSGFLGAGNEIDTITHQEQVREARGKFEEKERAKEEKYARQQLRKRERSHHKETPKTDRAKIRKHCSNKSSTTQSTTGSQTAVDTANEKVEFDARGYDSVPTGQTPARADAVQFQRPKRRKSAKHKTNGVWTAFMLWFRTRLLRMGRH